MMHATSAAAFAVLALLMCSGLTAASAKLQNAVTDWHFVAQKAFRNSYPAANGQTAVRLYAMVSLAQYRALKTAPKSLDKKAVAGFAAHTILSTWYPNVHHEFFDTAIAESLDGMPKSTVEAARAFAVPIANNLLRDRIGDRNEMWRPFNFASSPKPGDYQLVPGQSKYYKDKASLGWVRPFTLSQKDVERIGYKDFKPPSVGSEQFYTELKETYAVGGKDAPNRSKYDTDTATFWVHGAGTHGTLGHMLNITLSLIPSDLSLTETALFIARTAIATYDANILCYRKKYDIPFWRPITAIRQGFKDVEDSEWDPILETPSHPEFPSGHACTAGAAGYVYERFMGGDKTGFSIGTEVPQHAGQTRSFPNVDAAVNEVLQSRVAGGVHFRSAVVQGKKLARKAAAIAYDKVEGLLK